jgi:hypothetical protein
MGQRRSLLVFCENQEKARKVKEGLRFNEEKGVRFFPQMRLSFFFCFYYFHLFFGGVYL